MGVCNYGCSYLWVWVLKGVAIYVCFYLYTLCHHNSQLAEEVSFNDCRLLKSIKNVSRSQRMVASAPTSRNRPWPLRHYEPSHGALWEKEMNRRIGPQSNKCCKTILVVLSHADSRPHNFQTDSFLFIPPTFVHSLYHACLFCYVSSFTN